VTPHACASQPPVVDRKTKGLNQVQPTPRRQAEPGDISSIRGNFRFDEHNVEHASVKQKKRLNVRGAFSVGREIFCQIS